MSKQTMGIHHITAIVGHPQENVDFYGSVLGLRLVKKTINFDDPSTYHLYFGNKTGQPGTIITFFPWPGAQQGVIGGGQIGITTYVIPKGAIDFWEKRLTEYQIAYEKTERFGEQYLQFDDPHGLRLELVERAAGNLNNWTFADITSKVAIKGFGGAVLLSTKPQQTAALLQDVLGLEIVGREGDLIRFKALSDIGNIIDLNIHAIKLGRMGVGTVHHIAWRAEDDQDQLDWKTHVQKHGFNVTPVQDRNYFKAIYFREHGNILFEIATDPPGFAHDESEEIMGENLMLPPQYEQYRNKLQDILIPIQIKEMN
ncbi:MAG: ring-cleaving dioxygenase [Lysinibacillus sp.]